MNKKTYLIILYTATVLVILGALFMNVVKFGKNVFKNIGGWSVSGTVNTVNETWEVGDFDSIDANLTVAGLEIVYGSKNSVEFTGTDVIKPSVEVKNNTLYIKQPSSNKVIGNKNGDIVITVNTKELKNFDLRSNVGNVDIRDFSFEKFTLRTDVGEVDLKNVTVTGKTSIKTDVGEVSIADSKLDDTDITTNVGAVTIRNTFSDSNTFDLNTDVGDITCFNQKTSKHSLSISGDGIRVNVTTDVGEIKIK